MTSLGKTALIAALCLSPAVVRADVLWLGESTKNPIKASGIHVLRMDSAVLVYSNAAGDETSAPLNHVQQIGVDDEPDFSAAEQAYHDAKWSAALDGYQKAVRSTSKAWLRDRSSIRLAEVSAKLGRFDAAATAYVALVLKDPAVAAKAKPAVTDASASNLDDAIGDTRRTLDSSNLTAPQRSALLGFLLELYRAKKDSAGANQTVTELIKLGAATPSDVAMIKLTSAQAALDAKDYAKATAEIQQNRNLFSDPAQQAQALYILAQSKEGAASDKLDDNGLKDLALAYMRVVAVGKDAPGQPRVADSLLKVADIEEKLKEPLVALQLYQQIGRDYNGQAAATAAKSAAARLAAKGN